MLFVDEAALSDRVQGTTSFAHDFSARGPRDRQGRSVRDFDLKTRLFQYPCSYLIYSRAFDALPAPVKDHVYRRLWEVLSGKDMSEACSPDARGTEGDPGDSPRDEKRLTGILAASVAT